MRRRLIGFLVLTVLAVPLTAMAQQQTCEQRAAIMGQLIEDMTRQRAVVSAAEVEAASLKVAMKALQGELEQAKKAGEKKTAEEPAKGK